MTDYDAPAWDAWFESQRSVRQQVDQLLEQALEGRPKPFRLAVQTALLEHLAERMRFDIDLPPDPPTTTVGGQP